MLRLDNPIRDYAWGSRTAIAAILGRPPADHPQAEMWMGAHPSAPSRVAGTSETLRDIIRARPAATLGAASRAAFGDELPFLFKILAAAAPLSLQAHPSAAQARAGFEAEEAAGIPRDAPHRSYKDRNAKPELLVALDRFEALCGFRAPTAIAEIFDRLGLEVLRRALAGGGVAGAFETLMNAPPAEQERLAGVAVRGAEAIAAGPPSAWTAACDWAVRLARAYPGDPGVVASLMLEHVVLEPGQGIYLGAGNLHAYLGGVGVEIMAASDNVLRGGLTPKHVDVPELLRVLDFAAAPPPLVEPTAHDGELVYETPAPAFRLSRIELDAGQRFRATPSSAEIWLCTGGRASAGDDETIARGDSVFLSADEGGVVIETREPTTLYRARAALAEATPGVAG